MWHYHTWEKYSKLLSWRWWKGFVYLRLAFKTKNCRCHRPVNMWRETSTSRFYDKEITHYPSEVHFSGPGALVGVGHILPHKLLHPEEKCRIYQVPSLQLTGLFSSLLSCSPPIGWGLVWLRPCHPLNAKPLICHARWLGSVLYLTLYLSFHACACVGGIQNLSIVQLWSKVNLCFYRPTLFDWSAVLQDHFSSLTGAARWWGWQTGRRRGRRWSSASGRRQRLLLWLQR